MEREGREGLAREGAMNVMETTGHGQSETIRVVFREAQRGEVLLVRHMTAAELPADFAARTVLDLGIGQWEVVRAEPSGAEAFTARGELELWLDRVEPAPRDDVPGDDELFAPPSRQRHLPALAEGEVGEDALFLYADDWCQNELVSTTHRAWVEEELLAIRRVPPGKTRPRVRPAAPLEGFALSLDAMLEATQGERFADGVALCQGGEEAAVEGGFAFEASAGTIFYGRREGGAVRELGVHVWEDTASLMTDLARLSEALGEGGHLFVSWCSVSQMPLEESRRWASCGSD